MDPVLAKLFVCCAHHLAVGIGLPSSLAFSSRGSPSSTSFCRSSLCANPGDFCSRVMGASHTASPAKLTARTLYCKIKYILHEQK